MARSVKIPWAEIKASYLGEGPDSSPNLHYPTLEELAAHYSIGLSTIQKKCAREKWRELRQVSATKRAAEKIRLWRREHFQHLRELDAQALGLAQVLFFLAESWVRGRVQQVDDGGKPLEASEIRNMARTIRECQEIKARAGEDYHKGAQPYSIRELLQKELFEQGLGLLVVEDDPQTTHFKTLFAAALESGKFSTANSLLTKFKASQERESELENGEQVGVLQVPAPTTAGPDFDAVSFNYEQELSELSKSVIDDETKDI